MGREKIVVIGNGATAIDKRGTAYVNRHTGKFLQEVSVFAGGVTFIQPGISHRPAGNLHDLPYPDQHSMLTFRSSWREKDFVKKAVAVFIAIMRARLVYIFYPGTFPEMVARFCRFLGKPYGIYLRGDPLATRNSTSETLGRARFVTTVSERLATARGAPAGSVVRIRPMLDINEADIFLRDYRRRGNGPWRLLFVGRVEEAKGIAELLDAAERMHARSFPFHLTIVGGGPLLEDARSIVSAVASLPVEVVGPISDKRQLAALYEASDIFVLPTHHEGFPRVLYEAMIKSMLVVTTPVGGIPELMADGGNCFLVPVGDSERLAETIEAACQDVERMQQLSEAGLATTRRVLNSYPSHIAAFKEALHG